MNLFLATAIVFLGFEAVWNTWEFSMVYRLRNDKSKLIESHSRIGEGSELVVFLLAGILLYFSGFNLILTGLVLVIGLYHLGGTISTKDSMSKMLSDRLNKLSYIIMLMCAIEVVSSIYVINSVLPTL